MGKIIQTLANGQRFGAKESYLQNANDFLDSNTDRTIAYLNEVAV